MGVLRDRFADYGLANVQAVRQAPLAFIVLLLMALVPIGGVMAYLFNWRYGSIIDQQRATISFQDEQLSSYRQAASMPKPALPAPLPPVAGFTPSPPLNSFPANPSRAPESKSPEPTKPEAETNKSPKYFFDVLNKYNGLQAPKILQAFVEARMKSSGKFFSANSISHGVLVGIVTVDGYFQCEYNDQYEDYFSRLDKGDMLRGSGVLTSDFSARSFVLERCKP